MALQSYQVTVISHRTGDVLAVFGGDQMTFKYSRALNGIGAFSLAMPLADGYGTLFATDNFIEVARTNPATGLLVVEETFLVRQFNPYRDDDQQMIVVGGLSLNDLIKRRVVYPADDPLTAGGYSTKAGDAATVMRAYCREQMGDLASAARQTLNLTIPPGVSNGQTLGDRLRLENLFEKMQDFARRALVDFQIVRTSANLLQMNIGPLGVDRTYTTNYPTTPFVYFTTRRGNLNQPSLVIDRRDEQNFVFVQGQGQGAARLIYPLSSTDTIDSLYNRIEFVTDASNADKNDPVTIVGTGQDALRKNRAAISFTHAPDDESPGAIYRVDWDMGDYVTVAWEDFGFQEDLRITGIEITLGENTEDLTITVEER